MIVAYVVLGIIVLLLIIGIASYNRFVRQRNLVQESWRQIDVELTRRHDLVPNLVESVKGYAAHETQTLQAVTNARAAAVSQQSSPGGPASQAVQENALSATLRSLFAVSEQYPDLKASANFQQLSSQLAETEDRIAAGRRLYNGNVRALNTRVESFPSSVIAAMFHFEKADYFETDDPAIRTAPTVQF